MGASLLLLVMGVNGGGGRYGEKWKVGCSEWCWGVVNGAGREGG